MPEVSLLLDTDILIDALRGVDQAGAWLATIEDMVIGLPVLVRMEILLGARDVQEQRFLADELSHYVIFHLESGDSEKAQQWFEQFHLSDGIGILDCLIAAVASRIGEPFYTFNLKHFAVIPGLDVRMPYPRPGVPSASEQR